MDITMNKQIFFGIDPGKTGALAWIVGDMVSLQIRNYGVCDLPICPVSKTSKKNEVDPVYLRKIILDVCDQHEVHVGESFMTLEHVWAMPPVDSTRNSGIVSAASITNSMTCVKTVTKLMEIPFKLVVPRVWKKYYGIEKDKEIARALANQLFPMSSELLKYKKNADRAEALLIANYGYLIEG